MSKSYLRPLLTGILYDFAAFLSSQPTPVTLSAKHSSPEAARLVSEFLDLRGVESCDPNLDWPAELNKPYQEKLADWDDAQVQEVYWILLRDTEAKPSVPSEHWEGYMARRIVAALREEPKPSTDAGPAPRLYADD